MPEQMILTSGVSGAKIVNFVSPMKSSDIIFRQRKLGVAGTRPDGTIVSVWPNKTLEEVRMEIFNILTQENLVKK